MLVKPNRRVSSTLLRNALPVRFSSRESGTCPDSLSMDQALTCSIHVRTIHGSRPQAVSQQPASVVFRNDLELFPRLSTPCSVASRRHRRAMSSGPAAQPPVVQVGSRHAAKATDFHPRRALPDAEIHRKYCST